MCGYHLSILKPTERVKGKYLSYALSTKKAKHDFIPYAQGITRFGLSIDVYKRVKIYCPKISKQVEIANVLDGIQDQMDLLRKQADRYTKKKLLILQELLLSDTKLMEMSNEL